MTEKKDQMEAGETSTEAVGTNGFGHRILFIWLKYREKGNLENQ